MRRNCVFDRQLIKLVKARPIIWDSSCPKFRSIKAKQRAWEEIYKILDDKYSSSDKSTQLDMGLKIVTKWKNIRDAFVRSYKKCASEATVKQYIYHKELSFLLKLISTESTSEHSNDLSASTNSNFESFTTMYIKSEPSEQLSVDDDPISSALKVELEEKTVDGSVKLGTLKRNNSELDNDRRRAKFRKLHAQEASFSNGNSVEEGINTKPTSPDEDESFFASILSFVREMTPDEKLQFRMAVLKQIEEIRLKGA